MEVVCEGLDYQGYGIVKQDKVYFVKNLLPTERAVIAVTEDKGKYAFAGVVKFLSLSKERINQAPLSYAPLYHLSYQSQLKHQYQITKETFKKIASIDVNPEPVIFDKETHYRNKITLHIEKDDTLKIGTHLSGSHHLEEVEEHVLAHERINEVIKELNAIFKTNNLKDSALKRIQIRLADDILITFITQGVWREGHFFKHLNHHMVIKGEKEIVLKGVNYATLTFMDKRFKLYSDTFFQTNYTIAKKMFTLLKEEVRGTIVDAYAGVSTIGLLLSDVATHIYSIESNKTSYLSAKQAIKDNGIKNITPICAKVEDELFRLDFDQIIVDPPKKGLDKTTIDVINKKQPTKIIYISCNLKTLARDCALFKNYDIKRIIPVSMFPMTVEMETIAILQPKTLKML